MSRIIQLQREILNQELDKLEQDLRAVAQKKLRESNPQERNNLELQLQDITKQMQNIEQQLNQIEQSEETKDNTETLLKLLTPFEKEILTCVQKAYHACSPEDWLNPVPDNLTGILAELKKMPQGSSQYTTLERWVGYLVRNTELPPSVEHQLQEWGQQNIKGYSELLREVGNIPQSTDSYLMVVVHASNQSSVSNPNKEERYFVDAWFRQHDSVLDCAQLSQPTSFPETVTAEQIPLMLQVFLEEIGTKYSWSNLTIELFLPLALMNRDVDAWEIEDELGFPVPIGCQYQVLLRSSERLLPTYGRYRGFWQEKWDFLQQLIHCSACNAFVSGDGKDLKVLFVELNKNNIIGLKLVAAPPTIGKGSVFAVILKAATPVALWLRENPYLNCQEQIDGLLGCCIHKLPEAVANKRLDAFPYPLDAHIGHHLSLLWEDPYRLPPSIDYSM